MSAFTISKVLTLPNTLSASTLYVVKSGEAGLVELYFTNNDGTEVRHLITKNEIMDLINAAANGLSSTLIVSTIAERDALVLTSNTLVIVLDATGDLTVTAGAASYIYDANLSTWYKITEYESLDVTYSWSNIQDKPSSTVEQIDTAVAQSHVHANGALLVKITEDVNGRFTYNGITIGTDLWNLQQTVLTKADIGHSHVINDITGLQTALDGKANAADLSTKAAIGHMHSVSEIANLQTTLDGKSPTNHTHLASSITGLLEYASASINIAGPTTTYNGKDTSYTITNYDAFTTYTVSTTNGTITRSGETLHYTPATIGSGGFTINGKAYAITVAENTIVTPSITSPIDSATGLGPIIEITSDAFTLTSGSETHESTDWQIATDLGFTAVIFSSLADTTNKTMIAASLDNSSANQVLYLRVRYNGTFMTSSWSSPISITTKTSYMPTIESAILSASDKVVNDNYGYSVAIDAAGTRIAVGAYFANVTGTDAGKVYVYLYSGGSWSQEAILGPTTQVDAWFGYSLDITQDGDRLIIGAYGFDSVSQDRGKIYIYKRTGTAWGIELELINPINAPGEYFGESVAIDATGTRIVIGSPNADPLGVLNGGIVYIYTRSGTVWTQEATFWESTPGVSAALGWGVDIADDGSRVVAGAVLGDLNGLTNSGYAYIFSRSGTTWSQEALLSGSDKAVENRFGGQVSMSGDGLRVAINSAFSDPNGISDAGAVMIFTRYGTNWIQEAYLSASDKALDDRFGNGVSLDRSGSRLAVACMRSNPTDLADAGAVYTFTRSGTAWSEFSKITASDKAAGDNFGSGVYMTPLGQTLVIGSWKSTAGGIAGSGKAYVFT